MNPVPVEMNAGQATNTKPRQSSSSINGFGFSYMADMLNLAQWRTPWHKAWIG